MTIKYSVKSERIKYIQTLSLSHRVKLAKYMTNKNEQGKPKISVYIIYRQVKYRQVGNRMLHVSFSSVRCHINK